MIFLASVYDYVSRSTVFDEQFIKAECNYNNIRSNLDRSQCFFIYFCDYKINMLKSNTDMYIKVNTKTITF
jgi:hypothetical protein